MLTVPLPWQNPETTEWGLDDGFDAAFAALGGGA